MSAVRRFLPAIGLITIALLTWEAIARWRSIPQWLLPTPSAIVNAMWDTRDLLLTHSVRTLEETLIGLAVAEILGIALAIAMAGTALIRRAFYPILVASQTVPIIALAPLLTIWFGFDLTPKIIVVALVCFFPIAVSTFDGLRAVDPDAIHLLRAMGATRTQLFWRARWPSALPMIVSGTRVGATYGVIGAIVGEWVGASKGLGIFMVRSADQLLTERVFASIVVASVLSVSLFTIVNLCERFLVPWRRPVA